MAEVAYTPLGSILKARGLKGEMLLKVYPQSVKLAEVPKIVWLGESPNQLAAWEVEYLRLRNNSAFLKLRKINSRREADFLRGLTAYVRTTALENTAWNELVGFQIKSPLKPETLGEITGVDNLSAQTRLVIRLNDQREVLYPAVDELVESIDREQRVITLTLINELLSL